MVRTTVRRNFSVSKDADQVLDEKAEEWDMSRSELVSKAVLAYTNEDRLSRIEDKLDSIGWLLDAQTASEDYSTDSEGEDTGDQIVLDIIRTESNDREDPVPVDRVVDLSPFGPERAKEEIQKLRDKGDVYHPTLDGGLLPVSM